MTHLLKKRYQKIVILLLDKGLATAGNSHLRYNNILIFYRCKYFATNVLQWVRILKSMAGPKVISHLEYISTDRDINHKQLR